MDIRVSGGMIRRDFQNPTLVSSSVTIHYMKTFEMQNTRQAPDLRLGIAGFAYSDLYKSDRLKELLDIFDCEVASANPQLFAAWDDYRNHPEKFRTPQEI